MTDKPREPTASMVRAAERAAQGVPRETLARQMGVPLSTIFEWIAVVRAWSESQGLERLPVPRDARPPNFQRRIVEDLHQNGPQALSELAGVLGLPLLDCRKIVDGMIGSGQLERRDRDGGVLIFLTPKGRSRAIKMKKGKDA